MTTTRIIFLLSCCGFAAGCEPAPDKNRAQICAQAADFIGLNNAELQQPRDWNRLMTAASRLVYVNNECGELVTEPEEQLCAALTDAMDIFTNNAQVPKGPNRDRAIAVGTRTYQQSGCEGLEAAQ